MADRVIVDTDVLVGVLRDDPASVRILRECEEHVQLLTTDLNAFELFVGAHRSRHQDRNLAAVKGLLRSMNVLHTDVGSMEVAAKLANDLREKGSPIDIKDLLIGSIALTNGCPVLTGNKKDYERIEGLEIWSGDRPTKTPRG